ncbi:MAG: FAD-dependent oxidoreductase [Candidatus Firestonebacteria bacterium]
MKILIVGGVAGGASTAARLRRQDEKVEIIMFERGAEISYANCGIPYHIGKVIKDRAQLTLVTKEDFKKMFNVEVRVNTEILSIDRKAKTIKARDLSNDNTYEESYDKLVLSPGGAPLRPPIPGINDSRIFTIRNLHDMDLVIGFIKDNSPKRAVIVGAGFIGLEVAENLKGLGMSVSVVELAGQVMNLMDFEMAALIHEHFKQKNVALYLNDGVKEFKQNGKDLLLQLQSGRTIKSDMVVLSIGVKPEIKLAKEAGLEIGPLGGIKVSDSLQTADPDIYALGDAVETRELVSDTPALVPLANAANKQGRIVADNISGKKRTYGGTPATAIAKIFDLTAAITGNSEKQLSKRGVKYGKVFLIPSSHAGYYPDAFPMTFKLLYDNKDGRLLGAQIVGIEGIDKRIDVVSAMIQMKKTIFDLASLELAYAPPFSSAKDPVNLAGMIAVNQMEGKNPVVYWNEVEALRKEGALFLDVRSPLEFDLGHIEGALNLPLAKIRSSLNTIPTGRKVVVYCNQGKTAYFALTILRNSGYANTVNLSGGYKLYHQTVVPQENTGVSEVFVDKTDDIKGVIPGKGRLVSVNASGLQCPGPIMALAQSVGSVNEGDVVEITATDPGFKNDIATWCEKTGNLLLFVKDEDKHLLAQIQKGTRIVEDFKGAIPHDKTIVVFSKDLDKALAAFVITNGAVSMGRKVTLFFTFWGLNILRKTKGRSPAKDFLSMMFGIMMPKGTRKLGLSTMNMLGMGPLLIKHIMNKKNIQSLETLIRAAMDSGVRIVACQMSMDMMGIKKEELIDGVEIGGVANYLGAAEDSDTNLFI